MDLDQIKKVARLARIHISDADEANRMLDCKNRIRNNEIYSSCTQVHIIDLTEYKIDVFKYNYVIIMLY